MIAGNQLDSNLAELKTKTKCRLVYDTMVNRIYQTTIWALLTSFIKRPQTTYVLIG